MKKKSTKKFDMYEEVTNRIVAELENGYIPWLKPWTGTNGAWSRATGKNYSLINQFLMPAGEYITYDELMREGGEFIRDEDGKVHDPQYVWSFWYKAVNVEVEDKETGETKEELFLIPKSKYHRVWNVETDTTLSVKYDKDEKREGVDPLKELEAIKKDYVKRSGVRYSECISNKAYYAPIEDKVVVPCRKQYDKVAEFYSTVFHELGHSTGAPSRLNRFKGLDAVAFGDTDYSREELVAELTACSILANTGVETKTSFRNTTAYIQGWLRALKDDPQAIIRASAKAEQAYNLIMNITEDNEVEGAN